MMFVSVNVNYGVLVIFFWYLNDCLVVGEVVFFELIDVIMFFLVFVVILFFYSNMFMGVGILWLLLEMLNIVGDRWENVSWVIIKMSLVLIICFCSVFCGW